MNLQAYATQSPTDDIARMAAKLLNVSIALVSVMEADRHRFQFMRREVGPKHVKIEILFCGVCHSDIHPRFPIWLVVRDRRGLSWRYSSFSIISQLKLFPHT
jgi:hypothetical protein